MSRQPVRHGRIIAASARLRLGRGRFIFVRSLLVAQRDHRIDARGAAGGKVARKGCDAGQQDRDAGESPGIGGADAEQHAGERSCQRQRRAQADRDADQRQGQSASETPDFPGCPEALCGGFQYPNWYRNWYSQWRRCNETSRTSRFCRAEQSQAVGKWQKLRPKPRCRSRASSSWGSPQAGRQ